jgi:hypothetical protein
VQPDAGASWIAETKLGFAGSAGRVSTVNPCEPELQDAEEACDRRAVKADRGEEGRAGSFLGSPLVSSRSMSSVWRSGLSE